jgi:5-methylcytosine-specific restriction endonuclease McrA
VTSLYGFCGDPECDDADCITECRCERSSYPSCKYHSCYQCFLDRRADYMQCIFCARWHSPEFDTCFKCRPSTRGRDDAALAIRQLIYWRDGQACHYCNIQAGEAHLDPRVLRPNDDGMRYAQMHIDHIVPCAHGGTADEWNLQVLCEICNLAKGSKWWPGCKYENDRTALCRSYFTLGRYYFDQDTWERFHTEVQLWRLTRTWDPDTHLAAKRAA